MGYRRFGRVFEGSGRLRSGVGVVLERLRRYLEGFRGVPGREGSSAGAGIPAP